MQIREVITEFHFDCQVRKLSPKTIALYDRQLESRKRRHVPFFVCGVEIQHERRHGGADELPADGIIDDETYERKKADLLKRL